jgi:predicted outer membrane repeat protein
MPRSVRVILLTFALLVGLVPVASAVEVTTRYVGPGGGTGACEAPAYTTIQAAVDAAAAGDTIHLCPGTHTPGSQVAVATNNLTFAGDSAATTTVDGGGTTRLFNVTGASVTFTGLRLSGGSADYGGAIRADGTVTVTNSTFNGNSAGDSGGAISADTVTVTNSTFSTNSADSNGGAVRAGGTVTVTNSTFNGNSAGDSGGAIWSTTASVTNSTFSTNSAEFGGAISAGTVTVTNSTFSTNSASLGSGGAIFVATATVTSSTFSTNSATYGGAVTASLATVTNSTFSGNSATEGGGAILTMTASVTNSTFSGNSAGNGGAIYASDTADVTNSILAGSGDQCEGSITDGGGNVEATADCPGTAVTLTDLALGALADNGGPTHTMALGATSAAINAGTSTCPETDQRGVSRPAAPSPCDAGAYELVTTAVPDPRTVADWKANPSDVADLLADPGITLGGWSVDALTDANAVWKAMNCAPKKLDAVGCLAGQLLTAKLNVANGADACIAGTITAADTFLSGISYAGPTGPYSLTKAQRKAALALKDTLSAYNNNVGCSLAP